MRKQYQLRFENGEYAQNAMVGVVEEFVDPFTEGAAKYYRFIVVRVLDREGRPDVLKVRLASGYRK